MNDDCVYFWASGQGEPIPNYAALERDLDRCALELEASRELVVQVWKLAHRIVALKQSTEVHQQKEIHHGA